MSFIRQLIERKISSVTGAAVTFGDFKFSPMSGTIEVLGLKVAAERFAAPFVSAERIEAKVAVTKALKGEIVVKTMTIEKPLLNYTIRSDGTSNFDRKRSGPTESAVPKEGSAGGSWEFDAEKILIVDGRIEYRNALHEGYTVSIDGINASLAPEGSDLNLTLTAGSLARRDRAVDLGAVKLLGKLVGAGFRNIMSNALSCRASIGDALAGQITSSKIANRAFDIEIAGGIKMAKLLAFLPIPLNLPWVMEGDGSIGIRTKISLELPRRVSVSQLEFKTTPFAMSRSYGARNVSREVNENQPVTNNT